jgi:prepilin-type processing-associated H-X9-DG protein
MQCSNNMKQIGLALHIYHSTYDCFPAGDSISIPGNCLSGTTDCRGNPIWIVLLPHLEQTGIINNYNYTRPWGWYMWYYADPIGMKLALTSMSVYLCPSDPTAQQYPNIRNYFAVGGGINGNAGYRGFRYTDGLFMINRWRAMRDITDGSSNTLAVGESVHPEYGGIGPGYNTNQGGPDPWVYGGGCYKTATNDCDTSNQFIARSTRTTTNPINSTIVLKAAAQGNDEVPFGSNHSGGANFVFADGHVNFLSDTIDMVKVYRPLSTINGGEVVSDY